MRRHSGRAQTAPASGDVTFDPATRQVTQVGTPVLLSAREFVVLEVLMLRPGARLEDRLSGWGEEIEGNAVSVCCGVASRGRVIQIAQPLQIRQQLAAGAIAAACRAKGLPNQVAPLADDAEPGSLMEERGRVFVRFHRHAPGGEAGSGPGLAAVRDIGQQNDAAPAGSAYTTRRGVGRRHPCSSRHFFPGRFMKSGVASLAVVAVTLMLVTSAFSADPKPPKAAKPMSADQSANFLIDAPTAEKIWRDNTPARVAKLYPTKKFRFVSEVTGGFNEGKTCVVTARAMLLPVVLLPVQGSKIVYAPIKSATAFEATPGLSKEQCQELARAKLKEAVQSVTAALAGG